MLFNKMNLKKNVKIFYILFLFLFSVLINQYYGNQGINPIDSFFSFNSGYDILNGHYPFKDYWTITGPFIAFVQAIFFKILGVSWFSYVFHASIFNFIITISTFYTFCKFKLNIHYCFIYSLFVSILAYPSSGTPYVDHHASYLSVISIFFFILALKTKSKFYWLVLPIILGISFLSKQAPTGHFFLIISFLSIFYFIYNYNFQKILFGLIGTFIFLSMFILILSMNKISIISFYEQYILFPLSLGESRLNFLFPLEFNRIILRFKLIHLSYLILLLISFKEILKNFKYVKSNEFLIIVSLITTSYALIIHQLMTINGLYIFFIIPILSGFSHIYYEKYLIHKKYILYLLIFITTVSTGYYANKYIHKRDFMDLRLAEMSKAIDAQILSKKLNGLKWITVLNISNPEQEILNLKQAIDIIQKDKRKKIIVTDYQFISVISSIYDYSPSQVWFGYHVNPSKNSKYFKLYKDFFIEKINENEIKVIYVVKPLWGGDRIIEKPLSKNCFKKVGITEILDKYTLLKCDDLKK